MENNRCGLYFATGHSRSTEGDYGQVPLKSVSVMATVIHAVGQVEITQVYKNEGKGPIETVYFFPVDANGAVVHFQAEMEDGRVIKGAIDTVEKAKAKYEEAIKNLKTAFLGEEISPDIFKLNVGYLQPGAIAKVTIGYVTEVRNDADTHGIRFFIPTTIAPRYVSPEDLKSGTNSKVTRNRAKDVASMKFSSSSPAPLTISTTIKVQEEMKGVECLSGHKINVMSEEPDENLPTTWTKSIVTLEGLVTDMDRDFVLLITPKELTLPRLFKETLETGSTALMLHFIPDFKLDDQKVELIIVIDRSGSMDGSSIKMAGEALQLFLHSMPSDCFFNIVGFGSTFESLFSSSRPNNEENLEKAVKHSYWLEADLGGTEMYDPLEYIYSQPVKEGYPRQLFVLTDGEIFDTDKVMGIVRSNIKSTRVFALGIGSSASHHLVEGLAKAGRGTCAFVGCNTDIQKGTLAQLKNALQPAMTEVKVDWGENSQPPKVQLNKEKTLFGYNKPIKPESSSSLTPTVEPKYWQSPKEIPPVFDGNQLLVFGVFESGFKIPEMVKMTANSPDGPLTLDFKTEVTNTDLGASKMLHRLAVVQRIRELETKELVTNMGLDDVYNDEDDDDNNSNRLKAEIVKLSIAHGVMSKHTCFIGVDERASGGDASPQRKMKVCPIPCQLPAGFPTLGGMYRGGGGGCGPAPRKQLATMSARKMGPACGRPRCNMVGGKEWHGVGEEEDKGQAAADCSTSSADSSVEEEEMETDDGDEEDSSNHSSCGSEDEDEQGGLDFMELVNLQDFNGPFQLTKKFAKAVGLKFD